MLPVYHNPVIYCGIRLSVCRFRKEAITRSVAEAGRIFESMARVRLVAAQPPATTLAESAPPDCLDVHCDDGAWQAAVLRNSRHVTYF